MIEIEARKRGRPRSFHNETDSKIVQSLDKAIVVLKAVSGGSGLSLSEIADSAGTPAPTVYRALITMQKHGLVEFDETAQLWRIGVEAFRVGSSFLSNTGISQQARPVMSKLMQDTGETANLGTISGGEVVFLSQVETHQPIRAFFRPGTQGAIHASGIGKALFSFQNAEQARQMASQITFERFTDKTIDNIEQLLAMRNQALHDGYAVDDEERTPGMRCVAAPLFNNFGEAVASVSVSGPTVRIDADTVARYGKLVRTAADEITRNIGGVRREFN